MIETRDKMKARISNAMLILLFADKGHVMGNIMLDLVPHELHPAPRMARYIYTYFSCGQKMEIVQSYTS